MTILEVNHLIHSNDFQTEDTKTEKRKNKCG